MDEISRMLPLMLRAAGQQEELTERATFVAWDLAVGQTNHRFSAPVQLSGKTLVVATLDEQWKKQFENLAGKIIFKLNGYLGSPLVTRIHMTIDPKWVQEKRTVKATPPPAPLPKDEQLDAAAQQISNEVLRQQFLRTALRCLERHPEEPEATPPEN
ncbi:MAG: DUF721 domain-containing protein [Blastocatellia bacterium]|nr:DUF721 domain-containing protein [Blastocatellia bacterium]